MKNRRNIYLIVDNPSTHVSISSLSNINLVYLLANSTALLQPSDMCVIAAFKCHYQKFLCNKVIDYIDIKPIFAFDQVINKISLLDGIRMIVEA